MYIKIKLLYLVSTYLKIRCYYKGSYHVWAFNNCYYSDFIKHKEPWYLRNNYNLHKSLLKANFIEKKKKFKVPLKIYNSLVYK